MEVLVLETLQQVFILGSAPASRKVRWRGHCGEDKKKEGVAYKAVHYSSNFTSFRHEDVCEV
jgi:hypothetical protein